MTLCHNSFASIQQPSLDVTVSVSDPVLPKDEMASSNLLRVTVETAYSVPDSWAPVPGQHPSTCTVALEVPLMAEVRHFHFDVEQKSHSGRRLVTYSYEQGVLQVFQCHLRFSPITRKIKCWCSVTES